MELTPAPHTLRWGSTVICEEGELLTEHQMQNWFPPVEHTARPATVRTAEGPRAARRSSS